MTKHGLTEEQRFRQYFDELPGDLCWVWIGASIPPWGYGELACIRDGKRKPVYAHILAWEFAFGPVPEGLCVLHRCDNPPCVRPSHLFLGTQKDNNADCVSKGRVGSRVRKLSLAKASEIRTMLSAGYSNVSVAEMHGVSSCLISRIKSGTAW